ncbi:MAG: hypothetical protein JWR47_2389 [Phenylobacterium sp.]|nr:hypothetical protein [Phenylobacterium sp.]
MRKPTDAEIAAADLRPDPIPQAWVISGDPQARSAELYRSRDGRQTTFLWACGPCEYEWRFESDETAWILEGEAFVDDGSGPRRLGPGDEARFRAGEVARWRIPAGLRKLSLCEDSRPRPSLVARALRKLGLGGAAAARG